MFSFFRSKADEDGFFRLDVPAGAITPNSLYKVKVNGQTVLLTRVGDQLCAFSAICPHAAADLANGRLIRGQIKCPEHGYTFDIRSGRITWPPDEGCRLTRFTVQEANNQIKIKLNN